MMQTIPIDLFDFAYIPDWHDQIRFLSRMALGEPWTFRFPPQENLRRENFILEKYISSVFRNQAMQAQSPNIENADKYFYVRDGFACFNTGLVTKRYKAIFAYFEKNMMGQQREWWLRGFYDDASPQLRKVENLPLKPFFDLRPEQWGFSPNLPVRVNIDHILDKPENMLRIPEAIRGFPNLYMLLQTGVEMARRTAELIPSLVVPQMYAGKIQFLLPICLTDPKATDLVMTIAPMDGFYLGSTCLTPYMAYSNARLLARPTAPWLTELVS